MRGLALTILLLAGGGALAATTVYTWVDEQGVTHYSDQPHPGATKMQVQNVQTYTAPPLQGAQAAAAQPKKAAPQPADCAIVSPSDQQMLMNVWSVSGQIRLPQVHAGERVVLMLDGKVLPDAAGPSGAFTIAQIDRGAHTLAAQLESASGEVICQAPAITFYVHQPSQQAPNAVNRPHF